MINGRECSMEENAQWKRMLNGRECPMEENDTQWKRMRTHLAW
jgi:hypothetical protein